MHQISKGQYALVLVDSRTRSLSIKLRLPMAVSQLLPRLTRSPLEARDHCHWHVPVPVPRLYHIRHPTRRPLRPPLSVCGPLSCRRAWSCRGSDTPLAAPGPPSGSRPGLPPLAEVTCACFAGRFLLMTWEVPWALSLIPIDHGFRSPRGNVAVRLRYR